MNPEHNDGDEPLDEGVDSELEGEAFINDEEVQEEIVFDVDDAPREEDEEMNGEGAGDIHLVGDNGSDDEDMQAQPTEPQRDDSVKRYSHAGAVYAVAINPANPAMAASGGGDDKAFVWDLSSNLETPAATLQGHTDSVTKVAFSHDGSFLATGGLDAVVKIWDIKGKFGALVYSLDGPSDSIECLSWHSKGPILFAGGGDGIGWMWNAAQGKVMNVFSGHSDAITACAFTPDGKNIVTTSNDGTARLWDPKTAQTVKTIEGGRSAVQFHKGGIIALALNQHANGTIIGITGGTDGSAVVSNFTTGTVMAAYREHTGTVECCAFMTGLPCGVTGSLDKTAKVWDLNTQQTRATLQHSDGVVKLACIPSRPHLVFTASLDTLLRVWDGRTGTLVRTFEGHSNQLLDFDLYADASTGNSRTLLLSGSEDHSVRAWELMM